MDEHIRRLRKEELLLDHGGWLDEANADRVVTWLVASESRVPVVLVGAGFSRNARDRRTGKLATHKQVALWSDVVTRLARDLDVLPHRYDAPTLFEMYQESLGEAKLRDALRETVADAELLPGDAHDALASYPCEAVVTTNCLDTLLDRVPLGGWRPVVVDADLSTSGPRRDLIYLHGHRDFSDSWVMTRSQYEDFPRRKPVMLARVRQLLAQHPWLIVGFGLTDPNFHTISRLVGMEMRGHQPLSIALMHESPSAAERQHWRRLGVEIASPTLNHPKLGKREFSDFVADVIPKLVTTYAPTEAAAKGYIKQGPTIEDKLQRFRETSPSRALDRDDAYQEWKLLLKELLTNQAQAEAKEAADAIRNRDLLERFPSLKTSIDRGTIHAVAPTPIPTLKDPLFHDLEIPPQFRPVESFEEVQYLARLLDRCRIGELAEHFRWGLDQHIFAGRDDELPLEVITVRLARRAGWNGEHGRLNALLGAAVASARKYHRNKVEQLLEREAAALELELPSAEELPDRPHLRTASIAYRAVLAADFEAAAKNYGEAANLAAEAKLDFEQWAYTVGQADALGRQASRAHLSTETKSEEKGDLLRVQERALRERAERLAALPAVKRWLERSEAQSQAVLREVVKESRERERFRVTGGWGKRFGGGAHALWRSFRDLETIHGPPSLRRQHLEPLLPFLDASDSTLVLANTAKPRDWLRDLLSLSPASLADRQARDRDLIELVLADDSELSNTERVARLEWMRELTMAFRVEDVPKAIQWIDRLATALGETWVETPWGSRLISVDCWAAFSAAARWAEPPIACDTALQLIKSLGVTSMDAEDATKALYDLPWRTWRPLPAATAQAFVEALTCLLPTTVDGAPPRLARAIDYALFTLLQILEAVAAPEQVTPQLGAWKALLDAVREGKLDMRFAESRRAGFLLEQELAGTVLPRRSAVAAFADWFDRPTAGGSDAGDRREEAWTALAAEVTDESSELLPRLRTEVDRLLQDAGACRHYRNNPHLSYGAVTLLAKGMKVLKDERPKIGSYLARLVAAAPRFMSCVADALVREWWEERAWEELMDVLAAACGGGGSEPDPQDDVGLPTRRQIAVLGLFGELRDSRLRETAPYVWQSLRSFALAAVNDKRLLVANRAAFSIVSVAGTTHDPGEAKLYAAAMRRIAADPRVPVRSAVASAGPALSVNARLGDVRESARQAVLDVEGDDNAQVRTLLSAAKRAAAPDGIATHAESVTGPAQAQETSR